MSQHRLDDLDPMVVAVRTETAATATGGRDESAGVGRLVQLASAGLGGGARYGGNGRGWTGEVSAERRGRRRNGVGTGGASWRPGGGWGRSGWHGDNTPGSTVSIGGGAAAGGGVGDEG